MPTRSSDAENVQLVTVGIGLQPGRQASARAISEIRPADRVFVLADAFALDWVRRLNANCRDLTGSYDDAQARAEGFGTHMEPGISAEACLYADLDLDPGEHGVQSFEATQFLIQRRMIDPAGLLLLWQISQAAMLHAQDSRPDASVSKSWSTSF